MVNGKDISATVTQTGRQLVIKYALGRSSLVSISLFHVNGKKIADLAAGLQNEGEHEVIWNGHSSTSAAYLVEIKAGNLQTVLKVMMTRR